MARPRLSNSIYDSGASTTKQETPAAEPEWFLDRTALVEAARNKEISNIDDLWDLAGVRGSNLSQALGVKGRHPKRFLTSQVQAFASCLEVDFGVIARQAPPKAIAFKGRHAFRPRVTDVESIPAEEVVGIYSQAAPGTEVWIFSGDGFLEAHERSFFELIAQSVQEERVSLKYFFPHGRVGRQSEADYRKLRNDFRTTLGIKALERIKGYFIESRGSNLYAQGGRFVVVRHKDKRIDPTILVWLNTPGGNTWMKMGEGPSTNSASMIERMIRAIDPIEFADRHTIEQSLWRLPETVKARYRQSFTQIDETTRYDRVRKLADTEDSLARLASMILSRANESSWGADGGYRHCRWLDVGSEDGATTESLDRRLRDAGYSLTLTAIETSLQAEQSLAPVLKYSAFLNSEEAKFEQFARTLHEDCKFDLITSVHSWYLIDPIELIRAYRMLSEDGLLAILTAPFEGNVINWVVHHIDEAIVKSRPMLRQPPQKKAVQSDTLRNYGEDIVLACEVIFDRAKGMDVSTIEKFARSDGLAGSNVGKMLDAMEIVRAFSHGLVPIEQIDHVKIVEDISGRALDNRFPCNEIAIVVSKAKIAESLRSVLFHSSSPRRVGMHSDI